MPVPQYKVYHFGVQVDPDTFQKIEMLMTEAGKDRYLRTHPNAELLVWDGAEWSLPPSDDDENA